MRRSRLAIWLAAAGLAIGPAACGGGSATTSARTGANTDSAETSSASSSSGALTSTVPSAAVPSARPTLARGFRLTSPAFRDGRPIPARYTCHGADVSPPLAISGAPAGSRELVLTLRDPDAASSDFVHWALAGIPPSTRLLPSGGVPGLIAPGRNSYGTLGYRGPCPPTGQTHQYVFTLIALGSPSGLRPGFSPDALRTPARAIATLIGTVRG